MNKMNDTEVIVLGSGCSAGTPRAGNEWGACDPLNPKNYRTRPSIAVRSKSTCIVVDTGPDFRFQMNREEIKSIDAVLYTHRHSDHVNGMDDLRSYFFRRGKNPLPIYLDQETYNELFIRFRYTMESNEKLYPPTVIPHIWTPTDFSQNHVIGDIEFSLFKQDHSTMHSCGFRFGNIGYSTDMIDFIDDSAVKILRDVPIWIVDGANWKEENLFCHPNIDQLKKLQDKVCPEKMYLNHLKNDADYETLKSILPAGMEPLYDGARFKC